MIKSFSKIIAFITAMLVIVCGAQTTIAAHDIVDKSAVVYNAENLIASIALDKANYNFDWDQKEDLHLFSGIKAYEFRNGKYIQIDNLAYYPVVCNGSWIATIIESQLDGSKTYSISTNYANEFSKYQTFNSNSLFAVVFYKNEALVYTDEEYITIEHYDNIFMRDDPSGDIPEDILCSLNCISIIKSNTLQLSRSTVQQLYVPSVTQPTSYTCWAASMTSILKYYGYSNATVYSVCNTTGQSTNTYCSASQCAGWFSSKYYLSWGNYYGSNGYYYSIYLSNIVYAIGNGWPMFAGFSHPSLGVGHAVVVQGYVILDNGYSTASYMNPTDGTYCAVSCSDTTKMTISISGVSTNTVAAFHVHW